jgi:hypothetical protein
LSFLTKWFLMKLIFYIMEEGEKILVFAEQVTACRETK